MTVVKPAHSASLSLSLSLSLFYTHTNPSMASPSSLFCLPLALTLTSSLVSTLHAASASPLSRFTVTPGAPSSPSIAMRYHMGPVLTSHINIYLIWYGLWYPSQQATLRDFLLSVSSNTTPPLPSPSLPTWWSTLQLYTDQTNATVSRIITITGERTALYSHGRMLTRMSTQEVIRSSLLQHNGSLPVDARNGVYMVLTSSDVFQQDFCAAVCGFHYFTFPSIVGYTLPYAWIGNSAKQCPGTCAFPFAIPFYMTHAMTPLKAPNGDIGVDGMVSVMGHELAEMSSNPLINAWFAGSDPEAPTEIADVCEGIYGLGAGGGYIGQTSTDKLGASFNVNGINGRRFLVQWLWDPVLKACNGPYNP